MIKPVLAILLAATAGQGLAQSAPPLPPVLVPAPLAALRDDALANDHYAWDITEGLTTEVGQRLAGTQAEARARAWAVQRLTGMGFRNVRVETFALPVWTRGAESAEILAPFPQKLAVTALGNSASTGPQGITGQIVAFDSVDALRAAPDSAVRGKIVFVDHRMAPTQDGSSYGPGGTPRRLGPTVASQKGAIGIIVRSAGTDHHRNPHAGVQTFGEGAQPIPAGAISIPDAEQLARILKRAQPISLRLTLVSQRQPDGQSGNVIAEVPGRDPSLPPVLVGGHLDSWDLGTGAIDDASGVAIATPDASSMAPVPRSQLSRWPPTSTGGRLGSRPGTSAMTLPDWPSGWRWLTRVRRRLIGCARLRMRASCSASGMLMAPAGIGCAPSPNVCTPACGLRWWSVPAERTIMPMAPFCEATVGPMRRGVPPGP